jgi:hypothetical protein
LITASENPAKAGFSAFRIYAVSDLLRDIPESDRTTPGVIKRLQHDVAAVEDALMKPTFPSTPSQPSYPLRVYLAQRT